MSELIRSNIECDFLDEFINEFKTTKINNVILTHPNNEHHCSDDILFDLIENSNRFVDYQKSNNSILTKCFNLFCSLYWVSIFSR